MKMSEFIKDIIHNVKTARKNGIKPVAGEAWASFDNSIVSLAKAEDLIEVQIIQFLLKGNLRSASNLWPTIEKDIVKKVGYESFEGYMVDSELDRFYRMMNRCISALEQEGY